jgi:hypothetical protein
MLNRQIILVSGLVLAMMASQSAWAQQNAQPDATLDPGGFLPSGAATLHEALITTGTTEFIDSGAANPTTAQISLSSVVPASAPVTYFASPARSKARRGRKPAM